MNTGVILALGLVAVTAFLMFVGCYLKMSKNTEDFIDYVTKLSASVNLNEKETELLYERLKELEKKVAELPVNEMKEAARKEALFFEGLQNIMDYGPDSVQSLNKEGFKS